MSQYILKRKNKYLNERYWWSKFPHLFTEWEFYAVLPMAMQFRDRPLQVGEVIDGNLDSAIWTKLP